MYEEKEVKNSFKMFINHTEAWQSADVVYCCCFALNYACEMNYFPLFIMLCFLEYRAVDWTAVSFEGKKRFFS